MFASEDASAPDKRLVWGNAHEAHLMVGLAAASGSCFERLPAMLLHLLQLLAMLLLQGLQGSPLLAL